MRHNEVRILKVTNLPDCTCEAIIGARTVTIYDQLWRGLTRRGAMELDNGPHQYGMFGKFIFPSEQMMRKFVRDVKTAHDNGAMPKRTCIAKYSRDRKTDLGDDMAAHRSWKMKLEIKVSQ